MRVEWIDSGSDPVDLAGVTGRDMMVSTIFHVLI